MEARAALSNLRRPGLGSRAAHRRQTTASAPIVVVVGERKHGSTVERALCLRVRLEASQVVEASQTD